MVIIFYTVSYQKSTNANISEIKSVLCSNRLMVDNAEGTSRAAFTHRSNKSSAEYQVKDNN